MFNDKELLYFHKKRVYRNVSRTRDMIEFVEKLYWCKTASRHRCIVYSCANRACRKWVKWNYRKAWKKINLFVIEALQWMDIHISLQCGPVRAITKYQSKWCIWSYTADSHLPDKPRDPCEDTSRNCYTNPCFRAANAADTTTASILSAGRSFRNMKLFSLGHRAVLRAIHAYDVC